MKRAYYHSSHKQVYSERKRSVAFCGSFAFIKEHIRRSLELVSKYIYVSIKYLTFGTTSTKTIGHVLFLLVAPWLCGLNSRGAVKFLRPRYLFVHVVG